MPEKSPTQLDRALLGLRSLVLAGDFEEGQRLSEVAVAKKLGTSRTPLRQAMDRLVSEGILERIDTGGCRVATFTREDIADAIELRGVMEGTAARLAAERGVKPETMAEAYAVLASIDTALAVPMVWISTRMCITMRVSMICWRFSPKAHLFEKRLNG